MATWYCPQCKIDVPRQHVEMFNRVPYCPTCQTGPMIFSGWDLDLIGLIADIKNNSPYQVTQNDDDSLTLAINDNIVGTIRSKEDWQELKASAVYAGTWPVEIHP